MTPWGCFTTTSPRLPDKPWSWLVCVIGTLGITIIGGINYTYGVFLPVFLDLFDGSYSKWFFVSFSYIPRTSDSTNLELTFPPSLATVTEYLCSFVNDNYRIKRFFPIFWLKTHSANTNYQHYCTIFTCGYKNWIKNLWMVGHNVT